MSSNKKKEDKMSHDFFYVYEYGYIYMREEIVIERQRQSSIRKTI